MLGSGGANEMLGQSGNDTIISNATASDVLSGGSGTDRGTFDSSDNASSIEQTV
jgi:Ca2+-binding RTX toxin-like protein